MALLSGTHLLLWEDRASDDYIVDVENLSLYVGTRFVHARRNVNKFMRTCPDVRVVQLDLGSTCVREEIDQLRTTWTYNKGMSLPNEKAAMERLLAVSTALHLMGTGVYQQGRLIAFSIIELLERGYAMGHFAKCDAEFSGLSHYLYQATARAMSNRGCRYLNVQEDLGIAGLRTFKMLLRPISFLKKYAVTCQTACRITGARLLAQRTSHGVSFPFRSRLGERPRAGLYASGSARRRTGIRHMPWPAAIRREDATSTGLSLRSHRRSAVARMRAPGALFRAKLLQVRPIKVVLLRVAVVDPLRVQPRVDETQDVAHHLSVHAASAPLETQPSRCGRSGPDQSAGRPGAPASSRTPGVSTPSRTACRSPRIA